MRAAPAEADLDRSGPSRRDLLRIAALAGGGLVLGVSIARATTVEGAGVPAGGFAPDAFIRIGTDGAVTLIMPQVEMGQGIYTSISMLIAEELDIALGTVKLVAAPADDALYGNPIFKIQMTGASTSIRGFWLPMRKAGATAREMLVRVASGRWKVDPATCRTLEGTVFHDATGRSLGYGALVDAAAKLKPSADVKLKDPKEFRLIGKPVRRLDTADKVNGRAVYGIDARPEGLRYASFVSSPVLGGRVAHVDDAAARALPGVRQIVLLDDLVAVVADDTWTAMQGVQALSITWNEGANGDLSSVHLWEELAKAGDAAGVVAKEVGDAPKHLDGHGVVEARYELPFLSHAPMEPMNCTVHVTSTGCEIWGGTQVMTHAQAAAAEAAGMRPDQVVIHNQLMGGGFGRRLEPDGMHTGVRIARHVEGPVKITWTREEDIRKAYYRPMYHNRLSGRVEDGRIVAWRHRAVSPSILARWVPALFIGGVDTDTLDGALDAGYDIPHRRIEYVRHEPRGVLTSWWRGVGANNSVFSTECFMDRLAKEARLDPVEFRRSMLGKSPRHLAVLNLAAEKAGWGSPVPAVAGSRVGRGICLQSSFGSFLAAVADVAIDADGQVKVTRVVVAVDCGAVVNPDTVVAQVQGGVIFGLSAVLHGRITFVDGRVEQGNYNDYRVVRIDEAPAIEVHLIPNAEPSGGIGEPGTVVVQPAVSNAIYAATGIQLSRMPVDPSLLVEKRL